MERFALKEVLEWNNKKTRRKPLLVFGARQIGKTYLIKNIFAERYYKDKYVYVDFKKDSEARNFICGMDNTSAVTDAKKIIEYFSLRENMEINGSTLLIFDEIQEAIPIITSLKYFKQDFPDIPVIASGSMVRIKIRREQNISNQQKKEGFFFPVGAVTELNMYPVTFEEFLMNYNKALYNKINESYKNNVPLEPEYHNIAMDTLYRYLLVGGMPENVQMFLDGESLVEIRKNMISLFNNYLNDMELYQVRTESVIRAKAIFNSIYTQLNKVSKNYKASLLEEKLRNRDLRTPIDWLETASLVYKSKEVKEIITLPLMEENESNYRLYMMDTGFLAYQSGINMASFVDKTNRNTLSGIFFENYVACELVSHGFPLFYWKGKRDAEFEFIIADNNKAIPVDVKKNKGTLNSLGKFKEHNTLDYAVKISSNSYGIDENTKVRTIPLYMVYLYLNEVSLRKCEI